MKGGVVQNRARSGGHMDVEIVLVDCEYYGPEDPRLCVIVETEPEEEPLPPTPPANVTIIADVLGVGRIELRDVRIVDYQTDHHLEGPPRTTIRVKAGEMRQEQHREYEPW